ncbi:twitching motility protein PilT [Halorubrum sp. BOL3-1]|uniref:twitching motility protein PilT n=1 Tax=Halorubrum sp. BOL3-1 TaxID=2497325 RepID=UPI001004F8ED|nr:twitching motility protein PilT [Halorubrum sp. BOL3-1]QAU12266.1 twitching motility protein PilT [Halorubrum sp. BOL3-1]
MTNPGVPASPSVLNTTVLSNFAYIDQLWVVGELSGICAVPVVQEELTNGVDEHPYLRSALKTLGDEIPVATIPDSVANREEVIRAHLDPGEAQAFAVADAHDGRLLTDDGDARSFAKDQGVTVIGSVGVLLAAIDAGKINESTADEWLSTWIDEMDYYVPYRTISEYR